MSAEDVAAAQLCGDVQCPFDGNETAFLELTGCEVPYEGDLDDFCVSLNVGKAAQVVVVLGVLFYMTGVGAAMDLTKARQVFKRRHGRLAPMVGLFCQVILAPLFMFALIGIFGREFPVATRITAILIASSPGGSGSNLLTLLAWGDVELSVAMTSFSTLCAFGTMPFYVWLGAEVVWDDVAGSLKIDYIAIISASLTATLLPLIGLTIKEKVNRRAGEALAVYGTVLGIVLTLTAALVFLGDPLLRAGLDPREGSNWALYVCAFLLNLGGLGIGYGASFAMGFSHRVHRTIACTYRRFGTVELRGGGREEDGRAEWLTSHYFTAFTHTKNTVEVGSQNAGIPLLSIAVSFDSGPVTALFLPFLGAYLLTSVLVNYPTMLIWRYGFPLAPMVEPELDAAHATDVEHAIKSQLNLES